MDSKRFVVMVAAAGRGKLLVPVPGNPDQVWGVKQRHHVAGTVNGIRVRAIIEPAGDGFGFTLGRTSPSGRLRPPSDLRLSTQHRIINGGRLIRAPGPAPCPGR